MAKKKATTTAVPADAVQRFRDRIKEFRRIPAELLEASPDNFRGHPEPQREAMLAILTEIGFAGAALVRELPDGRYRLIDGHLRKDLAAGQLVPCLVLDVTEEEARTLTALFDPLGDLARVNREILGAVAQNVVVDADPLRVVLLELSGDGRLVQRGDEGEEDEKAGPPEMALRPYEHYDYVLVLARNTMDWQSLVTLLGLERVDASPKEGLKKIGLGRCIDAKAVLALIERAGHAQAK